MIGRQLTFAHDGRIRDNVEQAIDILRNFEPKEGYYLALSGGRTVNACIIWQKWPG